MSTFKINNKIINSKKSNFYLIAEIGHNHMGSLKLAKEMFRQAKLSGADAVKLQKRDNKNLYTRKFYNEPYSNKNSYGKTYGIHREKLEFNLNQYKELIRYAKKIKIDFFATPFDIQSVKFLEKIKMKCYKIASADILNTPLQIEIAKTKKPIILSTGGANLIDVKRAVKNIRKYNKNLCVLQCTASYPANWSDMNLRVIETYKKTFKHNVIGLSDHEAGIEAATIAYLLGARVFEKHFTLNRASKGTDHSFSLEPEGLRKVKRNLERVPLLLGSNIKKKLNSEKAPLYKMEKSIVASTTILKGEKIRLKKITSKSPGGGMPPYKINEVVGKRSLINLEIDDLILDKNIK
jgi:sialic acid synthase